MTTKDLAQNYQLNQEQLEAIILKNEMPHHTGIGYLIIDDDDIDFLLELYYKDRDNSISLSIENFKNTAPAGAVFHINGARGRAIDIYPNKCVITVGVTIGSVLTSNATDGEKTIYYCDCIGLQLKKPGMLLGYLQFETAASVSNNMSSNFFNENTFTYESTHINEQCMDIVVNYVKKQLEQVKTLSTYSPADELKKYKELFDTGALSDSEYAKLKANLLSL